MVQSPKLQSCETLDYKHPAHVQYVLASLGQQVALLPDVFLSLNSTVECASTPLAAIIACVSLDVGCVWEGPILSTPVSSHTILCETQPRG